jgi:hypothetical protein
MVKDGNIPYYKQLHMLNMMEWQVTVVEAAAAVPWLTAATATIKL